MSSADDGDDFGETMDFDGGFWSEIANGVETGDFVGFEAGASSDNEMLGGDTFVFDGNSMRVEEIGVAV